MPVPWSGCHEWIGGHFGGGRPAFSVNKKPELAYRVSYELYKGPIPKDKDVCHDCDNENCVNPVHLWIGDASANAVDMVNKGRGYNPNQKLTWNQVCSIRKDQRLHKEIAQDYGVTRARISEIKNFKTYKTEKVCRNSSL